MRSLMFYSDNSAVDYYYINRKVSYFTYQIMKSGDVISTGNASNPYFYFYETQGVEFSYQEGELTKTLPGVRFFEFIREGKIIVTNNADLVNQTLILSKHLASYINELIFEDVRKSEFPHLPSRQKCIWLISNPESIDYWLTRMNITGQYQILRIRVDGKLHKASEVFLAGDSLPMVETVKRARLYWSGIIENPKTEEVLCEGQVKVMEILSENTR